MFYSSNDDGKQTVQCHLCPHSCVIKPGKRGLCRVRENQDGVLWSLVYGKIVSEHVDPIEKKPIFHLLPGSFSFSIATVGCNFHCRHCQNYEISQYPHLHNDIIPGVTRTPEQIVATAKQYGCQSISYTYVEPTVFFEFAFETAVLAREAGLKNIFVSNGYTSSEATRKIAPYLDANNIDLKAFSTKFYRDICGARFEPILETINLMKELGVWVEITTLIIPGLNDSDQELRDIADFIKGIDPEMPWHISRFHPTYKMTDISPTPASTLHKARQIGLDVGLAHVYEGNIPGTGEENTCCGNCGKILIERTGYHIARNTLINGNCPACQTPLAGIFA